MIEVKIKFLIPGDNFYLFNNTDYEPYVFNQIVEIHNKTKCVIETADGSLVNKLPLNLDTYFEKTVFMNITENDLTEKIENYYKDPKQYVYIHQKKSVTDYNFYDKYKENFSTEIIEGYKSKQKRLQEEIKILNDELKATNRLLIQYETTKIYNKYIDILYKEKSCIYYVDAKRDYIVSDILGFHQFDEISPANGTVNIMYINEDQELASKSVCLGNLIPIKYQEKE